MVNSRAISVSGATRGTKFRSYHSRPFAPDQNCAREEACEKGNAEVDENALCDFADGDVDHGSAQTEPARQNRDEHPGVDRVEEDLEQRVERHQAGCVLRVALRQLVPHDDHGDAAGEADHDEPGHVFGIAAQEDDGECEHQNRADEPVLHERQAQHALVAEDFVQFFVADPRERRVHHQDQARCDGNRGCADAEAIQERHDSGSKPAQSHAEQPWRRRSSRSDSDREKTSRLFFTVVLLMMRVQMRQEWPMYRVLVAARFVRASRSGKREEQANPAVEHGEGIAERAGDFFRSALDGRRDREYPSAPSSAAPASRDTVPWRRCRTQ